MLSIAILFITLYDSLECQNVLKYLTKYEIAKYEILRGREMVNLERPKNENVASDRTIEILLIAYQKTFNLVLYEDEAFHKINIQTQEPLKHNNISKHTLGHATFYVGALKNTTSQTFVSGFIINNTFSGYIMEGDNEYLVEPANFLEHNSTTSQNIMYKLEDINFWNASSDDPLNSFEWSLLYRTANFTRNVTIAPENLDLDSHSNELFCEIEIVADHELYNFFQNDTDYLSAYLYFHLKYADKIFRKTDFTLDGEPDNVRLSIAKISIYTSPHDDNYPMAKALNLTDYLMKFVSREQKSEFCLSVSMAFRPFEGNIVGEAFRPDVNFEENAGGICDRPLINPNSKRFNKLYFNTGVINLGSRTGHILPLFVSLSAFTHEIGHSFGSGHDLPMQHLCSPPAPFGKYLMHPRVLARSEQRMQFSPCSRLIMERTIRAKGGCLKRKNGVCGNGIRERGEECDCGPSTICNFIDSCCTPSDDPERGCTVKKQAGYECSPNESPCCHDDCKIVRDSSVQCYSDGIQCLKRYCDGLTSKCSKPRKDLLESCRMNMVPCIGKNCSDNVCGTLGLQACTCWHDITLECFVCCSNENRCVPAGNLGILTSKGEDYVFQRGTRCNNGLFQCDSVGNCLDERHHRNLLSPLHITLIIISLLATLFFSLVIFLYHKKVNLENLLLLRNHI